MTGLLSGIGARSALGAAGGLLYLLHCLVDREAGRLLARRELLERLQEFTDNWHRRRDDGAVVQQPVIRYHGRRRSWRTSRSAAPSSPREACFDCPTTSTRSC